MALNSPLDTADSLQVIEPDWPVPAHVHALSTTRHGGVSVGAYASLNLGDHVGDDPQHVAANRDRLEQGRGLPSAPRWLRQVHGADVVRADDVTVDTGIAVAADAAWTNKPGIVCAVLTADCLPLLMCARDGSCVAAVHAGWRGLCAGVIERTIKTLGSAGVLPQDLLAWLGPAIGPERYEVDAKVRDAFLQCEPGADHCFEPTTKDHWNFSLYAAARAILKRQGLAQISGGDFCTFSDERFYSHRRDSGCGRQATLIWMDNRD